ncbi:MAG: hypothetical protein A2511_03860 [Deltaproteobacteria bacterium RIFOXYD12_FULL_50_9]|nr:MAG: hypothetical protein A2511_03860 [Deltaproteobacteria bacterium RIFOXYD12_FULL_50_9]
MIAIARNSLQIFQSLLMITDTVTAASFDAQTISSLADGKEVIRVRHHRQHVDFIFTGKAAYPVCFEDEGLAMKQQVAWTNEDNGLACHDDRFVLVSIVAMANHFLRTIKKELRLREN